MVPASPVPLPLRTVVQTVVPARSWTRRSPVMDAGNPVAGPEGGVGERSPPLGAVRTQTGAAAGIPGVAASEACGGRGLRRHHGVARAPGGAGRVDTPAGTPQPPSPRSHPSPWTSRQCLHRPRLPPCRPCRPCRPPPSVSCPSPCCPRLTDADRLPPVHELPLSQILRSESPSSASAISP